MSNRKTKSLSIHILIFFRQQKYVQDLLKQEAFDICDKILSQGAHLYVCGDVSMAAEVCRTLHVSEDDLHLSADSFLFVFVSKTNVMQSGDCSYVYATPFVVVVVVFLFFLREINFFSSDHLDWWPCDFRFALLSDCISGCLSGYAGRICGHVITRGPGLHGQDEGTSYLVWKNCFCQINSFVE